MMSDEGSPIVSIDPAELELGPMSFLSRPVYGSSSMVKSATLREAS